MFRVRQPRAGSWLAAAALAGALALSGCTAPAAPAPAAPSAGTPSAGVSALPAARAQLLEAKAIQLTQDLEAGKVDSTLAIAGPEVKAAGLDAAKLQAGLQQVQPLVGDFQKITGAFSVALAKGDVVYVVAQHSAKSLRILYSFAPGTETLNGLNLNVATDAEIAQASGRPAGAQPSAGASAGASVAAVQPTGEHAVDTEVAVGSYKLPGTLAVPASGEKKKVVVLMLAGSGPQDRDETIGAAGNAPLRDLADGLAAQGISSLRYDKRTKAAPLSFTAASTLDDEYFTDAEAALALLKERPELAGYRIVVLGHSQGAMVLPTLLAKHPEVAGGVSLAGSPRSLFDIMYDQNVTAITAMTDKTDDQKKALLADVRTTMDAAKAIDDPADPVPADLAGTLSAAYIASVNALDPIGSFRKIQQPIFFAQGEADAQVSMEADFGGWKQQVGGRRNVVFHSYPGLNHLFMPTQHLPLPADYDAPAHVAPQVISDLASWLGSL